MSHHSQSRHSGEPGRSRPRPSNQVGCGPEGRVAGPDLPVDEFAGFERDADPVGSDEARSAVVEVEGELAGVVPGLLAGVAFPFAVAPRGSAHRSIPL